MDPNTKYLNNILTGIDISKSKISAVERDEHIFGNTNISPFPPKLVTSPKKQETTMEKHIFNNVFPNNKPNKPLPQGRFEGHQEQPRRKIDNQSLSKFNTPSHKPRLSYFPENNTQPKIPINTNSYPTEQPRKKTDNNSLSTYNMPSQKPKASFFPPTNSNKQNIHKPNNKLPNLDNNFGQFMTYNSSITESTGDSTNINRNDNKNSINDRLNQFTLTPKNSFFPVNNSSYINELPTINSRTSDKDDSNKRFQKYSPLPKNMMKNTNNKLNDRTLFSMNTRDSYSFNK